MGNLTYGAGVCLRTNIFCSAVTDALRFCSILLRSSTSSRICLGLLGRLERSSRMPSSSCNSTCTARKHQLLSDRVEASLDLFVHCFTIDGNMSMASLSCRFQNKALCLSTVPAAYLLSTNYQRTCRYRKQVQHEKYTTIVACM
jgi:hypothetical protein